MQSLDFNICDLSFFPPIQALYYKILGVNNISMCANAIAQAFEQYIPNNLNRAFLSLFMNCNCILQNKGGNKYGVPHMGKGIVEQLGIFPVTIQVEDFVVPHEIVEEEEGNLMETALVDNNFDGAFELNNGDEFLQSL
jgi:hypothetical protein